MYAYLSLSSCSMTKEQSLKANKIGLDPLTLADETLVGPVALQEKMAGVLKWHTRSTLVKLWTTISIPEMIFNRHFLEFQLLVSCIMV